MSINVGCTAIMARPRYTPITCLSSQTWRCNARARCTFKTCTGWRLSGLMRICTTRALHLASGNELSGSSVFFAPFVPFRGHVELLMYSCLQVGGFSYSFLFSSRPRIISVSALLGSGSQTAGRHDFGSVLALKKRVRENADMFSRGAGRGGKVTRVQQPACDYVLCFEQR